MRGHMKRTAIVLVAACMGLVGCGGSAATTEAKGRTVDTRLDDAYNACRNELETRNRQLTLADEGKSLLVDTNPDDTSYGETPGGLACVLKELAVPQSTISKIERTSALMGVQEDSQDGLDYSWTYHPDNGVELIVTTAD